MEIPHSQVEVRGFKWHRLIFMKLLHNSHNKIFDYVDFLSVIILQYATYGETASGASQNLLSREIREKVIT